MAVMTIGDVALHRVEELRIPNKISYFTEDESLLAANRHWLSPHFLDHSDEFDLCFQSWIFESQGSIVLVDPCTGNGRPHLWPWFDNLDVPYIERLEANGFRAQDIDFVVCTHLHHDHCGWNTELRDGKWVPTFPNARYIVQRQEFERWGSKRGQYPLADFNEGIFERSVLPVFEAGLMELVADNRVLTPNLSVAPAPGHTLGHQMLHLVSAERHALFTGDCFHHPIQLVEPSIPFGEAEDLDLAMVTRRRLVELSIDLDATLIPAHLPYPYAVRAWREGGNLCFSAAFGN